MRQNLQTMLIFLGIGPVIGLLTFVTIISLFALRTMETGELLADAGHFILVGVIASYAFGAIPAMVAGTLAIVIKEKRLRHGTWCMAASSTLLGVGYAIIWPDLVWFMTRLPATGRFSAYNMFVLVMTCLLPALLCWHFNSWLDRAAPAEP